MEDITVLGINKSTVTRYVKVATFNNCIATINTLASLADSTLTGLANKNNFYCNNATSYNRRALTFRNTTMFSDFAVGTSGLNRVIRYDSATGLWAARGRQSASAYPNSLGDPLPDAVIALNAGTEISLFGSEYWRANPVFNSQTTTFYAFSDANNTFTYNGLLGVKIAITLFVNMNFGTLPANGYFIFRIRDVANSLILSETRVYNVGETSDLNRSTKLHIVCDATTAYSATVQYIGDPLTGEPSPNAGGRSSNISFQEL